MTSCEITNFSIKYDEKMFEMSHVVMTINGQVSTTRSMQHNKDTLNNVLATKQFVVNMVTEALAEQMNTTAQSVPHDVDEFELAGVTPIASVKVKPMRVKESPITFECELVHHYFLEDHKNGGACIIIGRIVVC